MKVDHRDGTKLNLAVLDTHRRKIDDHNAFIFMEKKPRRVRYRKSRPIDPPRRPRAALGIIGLVVAELFSQAALTPPPPKLNKTRKAPSNPPSTVGRKAGDVSTSKSVWDVLSPLKFAAATESSAAALPPMKGNSTLPLTEGNSTLPLTEGNSTLPLKEGNSSDSHTQQISPFAEARQWLRLDTRDKRSISESASTAGIKITEIAPNSLWGARVAAARIFLGEDAEGLDDATLLSVANEFYLKAQNNTNDADAVKGSTALSLLEAKQYYKRNGANITGINPKDLIRLYNETLWWVGELANIQPLKTREEFRKELRKTEKELDESRRPWQRVEFGYQGQEVMAQSPIKIHSESKKLYYEQFHNMLVENMKPISYAKLTLNAREAGLSELALEEKPRECWKATISHFGNKAFPRGRHYPVKDLTVACPLASGKIGFIDREGNLKLIDEGLLNHKNIIELLGLPRNFSENDHYGILGEPPSYETEIHYDVQVRLEKNEHSLKEIMLPRVEQDITKKANEFKKANYNPVMAERLVGFIPLVNSLDKLINDPLYKLISWEFLEDNIYDAAFLAASLYFGAGAAAAKAFGVAFKAAQTAGAAQRVIAGTRAVLTTGKVWSGVGTALVNYVSPFHTTAGLIKAGYAAGKSGMNAALRHSSAFRKLAGKTGREHEWVRNVPPITGRLRAPAKVKETLEKLETLKSNPILQNCIGKSEGCEAALRPTIRALREAGFEYRVRGVYIWKDINDKAPMNHYAVIAIKDNKEYVVDLTKGQFKMYGISDRIIQPEPEWAGEFSRHFREENYLVKYKDFKHPDDARLAFTTQVPRTPTEVIPDAKDAVILSNTPWYPGDKEFLTNKNLYWSLKEVKRAGKVWKQSVYSGDPDGQLGNPNVGVGYISNITVSAIANALGVAIGIHDRTHDQEKITVFQPREPKGVMCPGPGCKPLQVNVTRTGDHFDALIDGQQVPIEPGRDSFFRAVQKGVNGDTSEEAARELQLDAIQDVNYNAHDYVRFLPEEDTSDES
ncbi:hypothetical protein [Brucella sp. IR073]|uniref:hypothetical protein n=1 Tax=unclassified Brucella TaxID=2632610 RepID=UPI003B98290C